MKREVDHRKLHLILVGIIILGFVIFSVSKIITTGNPVKDVSLDKEGITKNIQDKSNYINSLQNVKSPDSYFNKEDKKIYTYLNTKTYNQVKIDEFDKKNTNQYDGYIVELKDPPTSFFYKNKENLKNYEASVKDKQNVIKAKIKDISSNSKIANEFRAVFNGFTISDISAEEAKKIESLPEVKKIYPNYKAQAMLMDAAPLINADEVWNIKVNGTNLTGMGVTIGIIDTGVDYTHPDLGGCFGTGCKVIGGWDFVNNDTDPMDDHFHGTHVASTAAGKGTLRGIAPDAKIYAYKVLDSSGSGSFSNIISAIERSIDPNQDGDFSDHLDIISMSLGGSGDPDDPMSQAVDNAVSLGVVAVIAAGNWGPYPASIASPGTSRKAITVGATHKKNYEGFWFSCNPGEFNSCGLCGDDGKVFCNYWDYFGEGNVSVDEVTGFSSRGPVSWSGGSIVKPDIVAPGALICAARYDSIFPEGENAYYHPCLDNQHVQMAGTSMAAPIVSGAVALLKQKNSNLTPEEIKSILKISAKKYVEKSIYDYGYGRLDISNAINLSNNPLRVELTTSGIVRGTSLIKGVIIGNSFKNYTLEYSADNGNGWIIISSSNTIPSNFILGSIDTRNLQDNILYYLRLTVKDIVGNSWEDISFIKSQNLEIADPKDEILDNEGVIPIVGTAIAKNFNRYNITYYKEGFTYYQSTDGISLVGNGMNEVENSTLGYIDLSRFSEGVYYLELTTYGASQKVASSSIAIEVNKIKQQKLVTIYRGPPTSIGYLSVFPSTLADINNDGKKDFIFSYNGLVNAFDINGNLSNWPYLLPEYINQYTPAVDSFIGSSYKQVALYTSYPGYSMQVLNKTGEMTNEFYYSYLGDFISSVEDRNKQKMILLCPSYSWSNFYLALQYLNGTKIDLISLGDGRYICAVADINRDGYEDIILKSPDKLIAIDTNSTIILNKTVSQIEDMGSGMAWNLAIADIDNDGKKEIIHGMHSKENPEKVLIGVWDNAGNYKSGWPVEIVTYSQGTLSIGDVNGDDFLEIVFGEYTHANNSILVYDYQGRIIKTISSLSGFLNIYQYPSTMDINNDGIMDIAFVDKINNYYVLRVVDINGSDLYRAYLTFDNPVYSLNGYYPSIEDFDGDGLAELTLLHTDGIYDGNIVDFGYYQSFFDTPFIFNNKMIGWQEIKHDSRNTGYYNFTKQIQAPNCTMDSECPAGEICFNYNCITKCTDTDGGSNIYVKGTVNATNSSGTYSYTDYCISTSYVKEYYCQNNQALSSNLYCSKGCSSLNKACIRPTNTGCYIDPKTKRKVCPGQLT